MINHIRTLLLNLARDYRPVNPDPYEEYIDQDYSPVAARFVISDVVMPPGLSRHDKLVRTFGILNLMDRPEYDKYLHLFDARISYTLDDRRVMNALADGDERRRIDPAAFYSQLYSVIYGGTNVSLLFDCPDFHPDSFAELKQLWMFGETPADRAAAAVLALTYWMERARNMVKKVQAPIPVSHTPREVAPESCCPARAPNTDNEWVLGMATWTDRLEACSSCSGSVESFTYRLATVYKCAADQIRYAFHWEDPASGCVWQSGPVLAGNEAAITIYDNLAQVCRTARRTAPDPAVYSVACGAALLDEDGNNLLDEDGDILLEE